MVRWRGSRRAPTDSSVPLAIPVAEALDCPTGVRVPEPADPDPLPWRPAEDVESATESKEGDIRDGGVPITTATICHASLPAAGVAAVARQAGSTVPDLTYRWLPASGGLSGAAPGTDLVIDEHAAFRITFTTAAANTTVVISHTGVSWYELFVDGARAAEGESGRGERVWCDATRGATRESSRLY